MLEIILSALAIYYYSGIMQHWVAAVVAIP